MRGRDVTREAERLSVRIENAVEAIVETGGDPAPILAALSRIADAAERGTPCLADAVLPDPPDHDARPVAAKPSELPPEAQEARHRRRKWGAVHKAALWAVLGEGAITGECDHGKRRRIRREALAEAVAALRKPMLGPWKRYTWEDLGAVFKDAEDMASCLRAIRDEYRRTECTWNE